MSQNLPWKRGAFEGAVIIVSVLLALAADAWWDRRQAAELEAYMVAAVTEEVAQNQALLQGDRQAIMASLQRVEFFLHAGPGALARLPPDSVQPIVGGISGYVTFDPLSDAAALLSQTAVLSPRGLQVRSLVSRWLTQVADADEEKGRFMDRANQVALLLRPYAARTAEGPLASTSQRLGSLGPGILGELRADSAIVEAVIFRAGMAQTYLNNLEALGRVLDSLDAALARM